MEKPFNFVYVTTNLLNNKQYIGDHSCNNLEKDYYLGSGRPYLKNALNEYGKENFKREILEFFPTKQEAFSAQEKYIKEYNTLVPNGYNISPTGGILSSGNHSDETKEKIRVVHLGKKKKKCKWKKKLSEEHKKKISDFQKGRKKTKEELQKRGPLSEEHKHNISNSSLGKAKPIRTKEHRENISKSKLAVKIGPNKKKKVLSEEHKQKMRIAQQRRWDNIKKLKN